jgi:hypothetical protein
MEWMDLDTVRAKIDTATLKQQWELRTERLACLVPPYPEDYQDEIDAMGRWIIEENFEPEDAEWCILQAVASLTAWVLAGPEFDMTAALARDGAAIQGTPKWFAGMILYGIRQSNDWDIRLDVSLREVFSLEISLAANHLRWECMRRADALVAAEEREWEDRQYAELERQAKRRRSFRIVNRRNT